MSICRKFDLALHGANDVRNAVYATETKKPSLVRQLSPQMRAGNEEYNHLRKAAPADMLLPRSKLWCVSLPERVQPIALMRQFPRIANLIAATWDNLEHFETYMQSPLIDKRGNRKGFPPDVLADLKNLEIYRLSTEVGDSTWAGVSKHA